MSKGKGGKIKNWRKADNNLFWHHTEKDMKMAIARKTRKGYPITLWGDDAPRKAVMAINNTSPIPKKTDATKYAAKWRRKLS